MKILKNLFFLLFLLFLLITLLFFIISIKVHGLTEWLMPGCHGN